MLIGCTEQHAVYCSELYYILLKLICPKRATFCERPSQNSALNGPQQHLANTGKAKLFFTYSKVGQASCKAFILREAHGDYGEIQPLRETREIECRQPLGADPRSDDCSKPLSTRYRAHLLMQSSHDQDGPLGVCELCHTKVIACERKSVLKGS